MFPAPPTTRLDFIQALRGIAAAAVVMFHARIWMAGALYLDLAHRAFDNAAAGVDLFFVISGFIMVHTTRTARGGVRTGARFLVRRIVRIWPVYVVATLALVFAEGTYHHYLRLRSGLIELGEAFVFYPDRGHGAPFLGWTPNGVGWTLNYEMWFYVLFALSLCTGRWRWAVLVASFATFLVVIPAVATGTVSANAYFNYAMSPAILDLAANSIVWDFLAGVAIGLIYHSRARIARLAIANAVVAIAVSAVVVQQLTSVRTGHGLAGWGPAMMVMVLALALRDKHTPLRVPGALRWLGNASFSLYLVHRIPQLGLPRLLGNDVPVLTNGIGALIATTACALILANVSYTYLELGLAEWIKRRLLGEPRRVTSMV